MTKSIKKPNFFIIGAPKCGTTAMAQYLGEHPDVFFSSPKEPNFFNTDFSRNQYKGISEEEYLENYFKDSGNFRVVGEGSVWYLYSKDAVPNILKFNPSAKFIVMMRNPIDMVYSLHNQVLNNADEIEINFERAWNLQGERLKGRFIPKNCREPKSLQYGTICMIGEQVERLYQNVPREKVKLIFFDDFKNRTKEVFEEVLNFLEISFCSKDDFPVINSRETKKSYFIRRLARRPPQTIVSNVLRMKKILGIKKMNIMPKVRRMEEKFNVSKNKKTNNEISKRFKNELLEYFDEDIDKLADLTSRDLSHWKEI